MLKKTKIAAAEGKIRFSASLKDRDCLAGPGLFNKLILTSTVYLHSPRSRYAR